MRDDFCVFILGYNRPKRVKTLGTLDRYGYTSNRYIVVNDESDVEPYTAEHGEDMVVYLPDSGALPETDRGDNFDRHDTPLYTRNQLWDLADELGYDYFLVLDDDYSFFQWRFNREFEYEPRTPGESAFDRYIDAAIDYIERADIDCLCMAQGGDFIGGSEASFAEAVQTKRKIMNTFLCRTDRPFQYRGTLNDDVNTYTRLAQLGKVFLTVNVASVEQETTQQEGGGLTDAYLEEGTYMKSFYTILYAPSAASLTKLAGRSAERIHHRISWNNAVPKIVPESTKND